MEIKSSLKHQRIAPRKVRLLADLIRGKGIEEVKQEMTFSRKRSANYLLKAINAAIANAKNSGKIKEEEVSDLYIKKIMVNEGPKLKRWRAVSRGSAHEIQKKTSHIVLVLSQNKPKREKNKNQKTKLEKKEIKKKNKRN